MLEGALAGTGLDKEPCKHEFDESKLPRFDKRLGCIYVCKKCGMELCRGFKPVPHNPRVRVSKKDRRRLKMLAQASDEVRNNTQRSVANYQHLEVRSRRSGETLATDAVIRHKLGLSDICEDKSE